MNLTRHLLSRLPFIGFVAAAAVLSACCSGCMQAVQQPGQTPAQVAACSTDATAHNILVGAAGVLSTGAGVESAVATQTDPKTAQGLAIGAAVTAGLAAASLGAGTLFAQVYNSDGCMPALVAGKRSARFGEPGWKPEITRALRP